MAQHIYLSVAPISDEITGETLFSYRGEAGPADDPVSFKRLMGKRGYAVIIAAEGEAPPRVDDATGSTSTEHWKNISRSAIKGEL